MLFFLLPSKRLIAWMGVNGLCALVSSAFSFTKLWSIGNWYLRYLDDVGISLIHSWFSKWSSIPKLCTALEYCCTESFLFFWKLQTAGGMALSSLLQFLSYSKREHSTYHLGIIAKCITRNGFLGLHPIFLQQQNTVRWNHVIWFRISLLNIEVFPEKYFLHNSYWHVFSLID